MRKLILLLTLLLTVSGVSATETTKFLADLYSKHYNKPVKIVSKQEYKEPVEQQLDDYETSAMVFGEGYIKVRKCKKEKISYIGLLDKNCKPIWAYIIK